MTNSFTFADVRAGIVAAQARIAELNAGRATPFAFVPGMLAEIGSEVARIESARAELVSQPEAAPARDTLDPRQVLELIGHLLELQQPQAALPAWLGTSLVRSRTEYLQTLAANLPSLPEAIRAMLSASGVTAERLQVELTAAEATAPRETAATKAEQLKQELLDVRAACEGVLRLLGVSQSEILALFRSARS